MFHNFETKHEKYRTILIQNTLYPSELFQSLSEIQKHDFIRVFIHANNSKTDTLHLIFDFISRTHNIAGFTFEYIKSLIKNSQVDSVLLFKIAQFCIDYKDNFWIIFDCTTSIILHEKCNKETVFLVLNSDNLNEYNYYSHILLLIVERNFLEASMIQNIVDKFLVKNWLLPAVTLEYVKIFIRHFKYYDDKTKHQLREFFKTIDRTSALEDASQRRMESSDAKEYNRFINYYNELMTLLNLSPLSL
jgi:hypothetical protein